jgi:hypothetical protein
MGSLFRGCLATALLGAAALLSSPEVHAQECNARAITSSAAEVYAGPPRFAPGVGWQGVQIERLSPGMPIFVCQERALEFGMTTQIWVQIGYRAAAGDWRRGWISKESVRIAVRTDGPMQRLYACVPAAKSQVPMVGGAGTEPATPVV